MNPCRILIVEDEVIVSKEISRRLQALGYDPVGLPITGQQALAMAEVQRPNLALMDIRLLGEMDGIETAKELMRRFNTPVVFLTAHSEDEILERAKFAEPYGYLLKPIEDRDLKSAIEMALHKHQADTRLKEAEKSLQESEEKYRNLFETMVQGVVYQDSDGRIIDANPAAQRILGLTLEQMQGRTSVDPRWRAIHEDGTEFSGEMHPAMVALKTGKAVNDVVMGVYHPGAGEYRWININATPKFLPGQSLPYQVYITFKDITERRKVELNLERTRNLLSEGQKIAHMGTFEYAVDTGKTIWSEEQNRIHGLDPSEPSPAYGVLLKKIIHPDDAPLLNEIFTTAMQSGSVYEQELRIVRPDGSVRWVYSLAHPYFDPNGKLVRYIGTTLDITDREQVENALLKAYAELEVQVQDGTFELSAVNGELAAKIAELKKTKEALLESEKKYHRVFENELVAIIIFDLETLRILDANDAHVRLYGYTREELTGRMIATDLSAEEDASLASVQQVKCSGPRSIPLRYHKRKDGSIFPVEIFAGTCALNDRQVMIAMVHDITERKQAEQALRESEERWQFALEGSGDGVWDWNAETGEVKYSRRWKTMLGFEEHEIGNTLAEWDQRLHPDDRSHVYEEIDKHFNGPKDIYVTEHRLRCKDGSYRWVLDRGKVIQRAEDGRPLRVIGTHADIHERKMAEEERFRMEQRLQQAQKAESLGRMAGAIAHNFNNMLGAVIGNLDLAQDDAPEGSELQTCIKEAMYASRRAADISRFMLTYLGQTVGKLEPVDPAAAIREACSLLIPSLPKRVRLKAEIPSQGYTIKADRAHLTKILTNLIENAIEAIGEEEGDIALSVDTVRAEEIRERRLFPLDWKPRSEEYARISIADTGCGIDPEQLDMIFDPFFSTKFAGRGLGLAVVLGFMRSDDGAIGVESYPGRGTSFKLFLPLVEHLKPVCIEQEASVSGPVKGSELVLVVDDEDAVRNMAEAMLKWKLGYEVLTARDGSEALSIFKERKDEIGLVLLDLSIPGMNGWETLSALRALRPDIPVILSSGYNEAQVTKGEHSEKPQTFLSKPYGRDALLAAIETAMK